MEKNKYHMDHKMDTCYCGKGKKAQAKTCIICSSKISKLRSAISNAKTQPEIKIRKQEELEEMLAKIKKKIPSD